MRQFFLFATVIGLAGSAGCGNPQVVAEAVFTNEANGAKAPLEHVPIRLLPYDRDFLFDSLGAAFDEPEPVFPPELLVLQREVQAAERAWITRQVRWSSVRDSLELLSEQIDEMRVQGQAASPQYRRMAEQRSRLEAEERQVNLRMQEAFAVFNQLRRQSFSAGDSIRTRRERWAAAAFADFAMVASDKLRSLGLEEATDITDTQGVARFRVPPGRWWVYARFTQTYEDLYWNVPIEVSGDSVHVILNRDNAQVTPIL